MPRRVYRCSDCGQLIERVETWEDQGPAGLVCICGAATWQRVPQAPQLVMPGRWPDRYVDGERRFRRRFVGYNQDGSETVYESLAQAERGERERLEGQTRLTAAEQQRVAAANVRHLRRSEGLLPGTKAALEAQAIEERAAGDRFR